MLPSRILVLPDILELCNVATLFVHAHSIPLLVSGTRTIALVMVLFASAGSGQAHTLPRPPMYVDVIGGVQHTRVNTGDTLLDIARRHDLGQDEILLANPAVDRWLPDQGTAILLPNRYIIPKAKRTGLILNVPEMRLYYFPRPRLGQAPVVITHPVSIGRMDWKTPLGNTQVVASREILPGILHVHSRRRLQHQVKGCRQW